jgi:hypothetical protein
MEQPSTFGMTVRQLRDLFDVGRGPIPRAGPEHDLTRDLLESALSQNLPLDDHEIAQLPEALGQLCQAMGQLTGDAVGEILKNPSSDLHAIRRVKTYAKHRAEKAGSKEEHDALAAVYYAAIAHGLVFHNRRITQFLYPALAETYSRLSKETWVPQDLATLFRSAQAWCQDRTRSQ